MAKILTVHLLVDDSSDAAIEAGVTALLASAEKGWIVDHNMDLPFDAPKEIEDAIVNETYTQGDTFHPHIFYSLEEAVRSDGAGFWSNTYGFTTRDLATRFLLTDGPLDRPITGGDIVLMREDGQACEQWVVTLFEKDGDSHQEDAAVFECWADNAEHAKEQAANAYPDCEIAAASRI